MRRVVAIVANVGSKGGKGIPNQAAEVHSRYGIVTVGGIRVPLVVRWMATSQRSTGDFTAANVREDNVGHGVRQCKKLGWQEMIRFSGKARELLYS